MRKPPILMAVFAGFALLTATASSMAAEETPKAFLEKLYANYVGPNRKGVMSDSDKVLARYLTPDVIKLMDKMYAAAKKADEVPALDGDPFVDAQDWEIKRFDITVDQAGDDNATGRVHFKNQDQEKSLTVDLVHLKAGWRIDDIDWGGSEGTLRKLLTTPETQ